MQGWKSTGGHGSGRCWSWRSSRINDNSRVEELRPRKVLVKHVETVTGSKDAIDVVQSVVMKLAKSVRFEQIWRSGRGNKEASSDEAVHDVCHFYDIVCVDDEERPVKVQEHEELSLGDQRLLSSYLPLLREFIPSAAAEIESDPCLFSVQDDYVYDYYTVKDNMAMEVEYVSSPFPLVQVEEDDFYDGPDDESEAEKHLHNEYPVELSEDEDDDDSEEEDEEEEDETVDTKVESDYVLDQGHKAQGLFAASLYENGIDDIIRYAKNYYGDGDIDCQYGSEDEHCK